jgi:hypothetical protein
VRLFIDGDRHDLDVPEFNTVGYGRSTTIIGASVARSASTMRSTSWRWCRITGCVGVLRRRCSEPDPATAEIAMTLDVYSGLFNADLDGVADRMDAVGRGAVSPTFPAHL